MHVSVTTTTSGLNVTVNGAQVITYTGTIPSNVYVGFTGGTGGLTDRHAVENVAITAGPPPPGALSMSASTLSFGNVNVGQSANGAFTLSNTGGTALSVTAVSAPAAPFNAPAPLTVGTTINPGQTLTQNVTFSPTTTGPASGSYSITVNDGQPAHVVSLSGTGVTSGGTTTVPSPVVGGWTLLGSSSVVSSTSPATLQLTSATANQAGTAFYPTAVPGAGITASFDALIDSGTGADGLTFMLADATAGQPILGVTGGGLGFSGNKGLAVALDTYHNQVNPSANFVGVATGAGPSPDTLTWGATATNVASLRGTPVHVSVTTTTSGLNVTVNGAQVITYTGTIPSNVYVGFTGGTGGLTDRHAVENVAITAGPPPPGALSMSASTLSFGNVNVGQSANGAFTLSNTGGTALSVTAVSAPAAPFNAPAPLTVGTTINPGQTLTQNVTFSPTTTGPASGSYSITVNDGQPAHVVSLSGTGVTSGGTTTVPSPVVGGWTLLGSSSVVSSTSPATLQLTSATANQAGTAFYPTAVPGGGDHGQLRRADRLGHRR